MVSLDEPERNKAFAESVGAEMVLLSDPKKKMAAEYGVLAPGGNYTRRWTFYIDGDGILRDIDKNVNPGTAGQDIVERLEALGFPRLSSSPAP